MGNVTTKFSGIFNGVSVGGERRAEKKKKVNFFSAFRFQRKMQYQHDSCIVVPVSKL